MHSSLTKQKENIASLETMLSQAANVNHQLQLDKNELNREKSELVDRITMLESTKKNLEVIVRDQRNQISTTEKLRLELIKKNSDLLKQLGLTHH